MKQRIFNLGIAIMLTGLFVALGSAAQAQAPARGVRVASADIDGDIIVRTPRGDYKADFQIEAQVFFPYGLASGYLKLNPKDDASPHSGGVNMLFCDGSVRFSRDGRIEQVLLSGRTTGADPLPVLLVIANQDYDEGDERLIYTLIGSQIHATWEAKGRFEPIQR